MEKRVIPRILVLTQFIQFYISLIYHGEEKARMRTILISKPHFGDAKNGFRDDAHAP